MSYPIKDFKKRAEKLVALEMSERKMQIIITRVLQKLKTKSRTNKNKKVLQWLRSILDWTRKDKYIKKKEQSKKIIEDIKEL